MTALELVFVSFKLSKYEAMPYWACLIGTVSSPTLRFPESTAVNVPNDRPFAYTEPVILPPYGLDPPLYVLLFENLIELAPFFNSTSIV
ncbi:hypothetical protein J21TS7_26900 [Paenibacillus cineris]|uniref:Uncharacterized protein n=1 Tax=Paenibacillus cineris TaxID=237530 RepID=A0ABQ4LD17_9BACL|nr:hypothetical protein J21TS7_26900 [Paenibacillus cineris]